MQVIGISKGGNEEDAFEHLLQGNLYLMKQVKIKLDGFKLLLSTVSILIMSISQTGLIDRIL